MRCEIFGSTTLQCLKNAINSSKRYSWHFISVENWCTKFLDPLPPVEISGECLRTSELTKKNQALKILGTNWKSQEQVRYGETLYMTDFQFLIFSFFHGFYLKKILYFWGFRSNKCFKDKGNTKDVSLYCNFCSKISSNMKLDVTWFNKLFEVQIAVLSAICTYLKVASRTFLLVCFLSLKELLLN